MRSLENRVPPPLAALLIAAAMWALKLVESPLGIESRWRLGVAGLLSLAAASVASSAAFAFVRAKTTINPRQIDRASTVVTTGVFRITRNPMYVGLTLLLTGWAVFLAMPAALAGPVALALFLRRFQIIPEERAMEAKFGRQYLEYKARVPRWLW